MAGINKKLTVFGLTMVAIGSCIGSGIFLTPSMIADHLMSEVGILLIWALGGLVALCGALTFSELSIRFPHSGGVYVYLRECYGDIVAFLYGWTILSVVTSGAIAALSIAFATYIDFIIPIGPQGIIILAISGIIIVTLINIRGVKQAEMFSNILTVSKLVGIMAIVVIGMLWSLEPVSFDSLIGTSDYTWAAALSGAMIGIFWSYGGWHHASYLAGETHQPQKNVPRAMILGTIIVSLMYVMANWAYLKLLGVEGMANSSAVASDAISRVFASGAVAIAILIAISTFGSKGIYTLSAPRIYHAMAKDGLFFPQFSQIHYKFKTPVFAILLQSIWAIFLVCLWQTFENLITYVVFMDWLFMLLAAMSIFVFRKKDGTLPSYKVPLYPVTPLVFIIVSCLFLIITLYHKPEQAVAGVVLLGLGIPLFILMKKKYAQQRKQL
jgi:APA family basic amino acid/polyamine antiporter